MKYYQTHLTINLVPDRLTVFAFLWACQALVHQGFFSKWFEQDNYLGWTLTLIALATMLFPKSLLLLTGLLTSSILFNVIVNWPFVANHILLESIINLTILGAIVTTIVIGVRKVPGTDLEIRNLIFDRFAPVVGAMMVLMYYLIFVTKLNWDFINLDASCVASFYGDVLRRFSFLPLPTGHWAIVTSLWIFLVIEILLPLMLTFRKTRYPAFIIGLPFHLLLGLIGHWTFSAFIFALYGLLCADSISALLSKWKELLGSKNTFFVVWVFRGIVIITAAYYVFSYIFGYSVKIEVYRIWFFWSVFAAALYYIAIAYSYKKRDSLPTLLWSSKPKLLWIMLVVVFVNGLSPYLGLKTETSFAMYSSLRTEGDKNNHFFMPALRLTNYQDDLVEIVETDHPKLRRLMEWYSLGHKEKIKRKQLIVYFELRRITSESNADFYVKYLRGGELFEYNCCDGQNNASDLDDKHHIFLSKLLYFRPVFKGEVELCRH